MISAMSTFHLFCIAPSSLIHCFSLPHGMLAFSSGEMHDLRFKGNLMRLYKFFLMYHDFIRTKRKIGFYVEIPKYMTAWEWWIPFPSNPVSPFPHGSKH